VHRFLQAGIFCERAKLTHHRAGDWKPARDIFHLRQRRFLRRADINEKRDKDQKWVPEQSEETKDKRESLANGRGDLRSTRIAHPRGQQRAQYASAIHWERRQQIKKNQDDVNRQQLRNETAALDCRRIKQSL